MSDGEDIRARAGLCGHCVSAVVRPTNRGTVYLRCALSGVDRRFPKYPRLPVLDCPGYRPVARLT
jgi:hypothetical protein